MRLLLLFVVVLVPLHGGADNPLRVVIDPGHGGKDYGAVHGSLKESTLTLAVSKKLLSKLEGDSGFQADLTRTVDTFLPLSERTKFAHDRKADLLVSVHVNWAGDPKAHGVEIYFQNQLPADEEALLQAARENAMNSDQPLTHKLTYDMTQNTKSPEIRSILEDLMDNQKAWSSSQLAKNLVVSWYGTDKPKGSRIRQAPFYLVSNAPMPSVLIELGYLSNEQEARILSSPEHQDALAEKIFNGIKLYKDSLDKPRHSP